MTIELYIAVLLTVVVLCIVAVSAGLIVALVQVKRAARSLKRAADRAGDQVERVGDVASGFGQAAMGLAGFVGKKSLLSAGVLISLIRLLRGRRKKTKNPFEDKDEETDD